MSNYVDICSPLPDWYVIASLDSMFTTADILKIILYKDKGGIASAVEKGCFPPPDSKKLVKRGKGKVTCNFWKKSTLEKWMQDKRTAASR